MNYATPGRFVAFDFFLDACSLKRQTKLALYASETEQNEAYSGLREVR